MKLIKRTPEEEFNLLEKQIGKEIFVTAFHCGLINPITVKDKLAEVIPYEEIKTKPSAVSIGHMTFLGPIGGISSIKDENGNLLYECAEVVEMVRKDNEVKRIHYANSYRRRKFGSGHDLSVLAEDEFDLLNKYIGEKIEISILTYGAEPYTDTGTLERFARFIGLWVRENNFVESGYAFMNDPRRTH